MRCIANWDTGFWSRCIRGNEGELVKQGSQHELEASLPRSSMQRPSSANITEWIL